MSRPKLPPLLSRLLCLQIDMQNVNLRQLSNLTSASKLSKPEPVQNRQRVRLQRRRAPIRLRVRVELQSLQLKKGMWFQSSKPSKFPPSFWIYFCITLCFIYLTKYSLYVFRTRVFSSIVIYVKLYIFKRKYTSCYPGSNIDVSTHCFLCSFVSTTCKYNWIYRLQFWDLKSIISVLGF
jgi:hypothetical protein